MIRLDMNKRAPANCKMQIAVATRSRSRGVSLVELMIAMMVIAIALVAMMVTLLEGQRFATEAHENTLALNAARSALEQMRQTQFDQIFSTFRAGQPLSTFTVPGLKPDFRPADRGEDSDA